MSDTVRIEMMQSQIFSDRFSPEAVQERVKDALEVMMLEAGGYLSEEQARQDVVFLGHMKGAWVQTTGVDVLGAEIVGFSDPTPTAPYAWFVIHGRKPGKMPPVNALLPWVMKRTGIQGMRARSVAFLIARRIGKRGTKPHDIITPVVAAHINEWQQRLSDAVAGGAGE